MPTDSSPHRRTPIRAASSRPCPVCDTCASPPPPPPALSARAENRCASASPGFPRIPIMSAEISFPARLAQLAAEAPDIVAITFVDRDGLETDVTRRDLHLRATRLARVLAQRGVGPDTMVVTGIPNSIEHIAIAIAAWRCGACTVAQSARAPEREFAETLKLLDARFVIADRAGADMSHAEIRAVSLDDSRDAEPVPGRVAHPGKAT